MIARVEAVEATADAVTVTVTIERVLRGALAPGRVQLRGPDHHAGFPVGSRRLLLLGAGEPPLLQCTREECPPVEEPLAAAAVEAWLRGVPQGEAPAARSARLAPLLLSPSRALQAHAARVLAQVELLDEGAIAPLLSALGGSGEAAPAEGCLRVGALLAGSSLADERLVAAIEGVRAPACRRALLAPLGARARAGPAVRALLLRELDAADERVWFSAATALAAAGAPEALRRLRDAPGERRVERRRDAAAALASLSCEGVDEAAQLARQLAQDPAKEVAAAGAKGCPPRASRLAPLLAGGLAFVALVAAFVARRRRRN